MLRQKTRLIILNSRIMPKPYIPKKRLYDEEDVTRALLLIDNGELSLRQAAKHFHIDKSVLSRRRTRVMKKQGRKICLTEEMESDLSDKIRTMAKWGFALTKREILEIVQTYVQENNVKTQFKDGKPGNDWFRKFCKRNKLSQKKLEQLEKSRRAATSDPYIVYGFYERLEGTIRDLNLQDKPANIWNLDETSFSADPSRIKGVAGKGQKVHRNIEGSGKENTTVMACISANGILLPPLIIFQGLNLWSSWKGNNDLPNTCYACSEKGWMTTVIFQEWFQKFCSMVHERPLLVILDGHITHLDKGTIERAIKENITLLKLPAHTTDLLQPLDKCCFGPLKLKWNQALIEWQRLNQRKLSKSEFSDLICQIWNDGISEINIKSSFEKTGIYPCNKDKYPTHRLDPLKFSRYREMGAPEQMDIFENNDTTPDTVETEVPGTSETEVPGTSKTEVAGTTETEVPDTTEPEVLQTTELLLDLEAPSTSEISRKSMNGRSPSCFESLLLAKIKRTAPTNTQRRKVDGTAKVLTSAEYLHLIHEKENQKKNKPSKTKKRKIVIPETDSDETDEEHITYNDESDLENLTLADIVREEHVTSESEDCETENEIELKKDDYALVKFCTKTKVVYYVALVNEVRDDEVDVTYLRRKGTKFIEPAIEERYSVMKADVIKRLSPPTCHGGTSRTAKQFIFEIDFAKYNVH